MNEEVSMKPAFSERRWQGLAKRNCIANTLHGPSLRRLSVVLTGELEGHEN